MKAARICLFAAVVATEANAAGIVTGLLNGLHDGIIDPLNTQLGNTLELVIDSPLVTNPVFEQLQITETLEPLKGLELLPELDLTSLDLLVGTIMTEPTESLVGVSLHELNSGIIKDITSSYLLTNPLALSLSYGSRDGWSRWEGNVQGGQVDDPRYFEDPRHDNLTSISNEASQISYNEGTWDIRELNLATKSTVSEPPEQKAKGQLISVALETLPSSTPSPVPAQEPATPDPEGELASLFVEAIDQSHQNLAIHDAKALEPVGFNDAFELTYSLYSGRLTEDVARIMNVFYATLVAEAGKIYTHSIADNRSKSPLEEVL